MSATPKPSLDLAPLLTDQIEFANIVKLAAPSAPPYAPRMDLLFVRFLEDVVDEHGLAEVLCHQVVNYAIPKRKLKAIRDQLAKTPSDLSFVSKLTSEARKAFIKYKASTSGTPESRYSELGEVVAFCVASHYLQAGQVAAKMALKTSSEMPVFGLDGIHVRAGEDGKLTIFFLESKMVGNAEGGCKQFSESALSFQESRKMKLNEQRIARDLSNLDLLEDAARAAALEYFDPYSKKQADVRERHVGVIIYSEECYANKLAVTEDLPLDVHEHHFISHFRPLREKRFEQISKALTGKKVVSGKCRVFFLAVPDVGKLKDLFAKEMGNEHIR